MECPQVSLLATAPAPITALSWRDETTLVGGTVSGQVIEWSRATCASPLDVHLGVAVRSIEAAHNPTVLLLTFVDHTVVHFNRASGDVREVWAPELDGLDFVHLSWSNSGSSDVIGTRLACAYEYTSKVVPSGPKRTWELSILDVSKETSLGRYCYVRDDAATCAALIANGTAVVVGTSDGRVLVASPWFSLDALITQALEEPVMVTAAARIGAPFSAAYTAVGRGQVFTFGPLGERRWERTGEEPSAAIVSRDSSRLAIGDIGGTVRVHDVATGTCIASVEMGAPVGALEFNPPGTQLACAAAGTRRPWCLQLPPRAPSAKVRPRGVLARAFARLSRRRVSSSR